MADNPDIITSAQLDIMKAANKLISERAKLITGLSTRMGKAAQFAAALNERLKLNSLNDDKADKIKQIASSLEDASKKSGKFSSSMGDAMKSMSDLFDSSKSKGKLFLGFFALAVSGVVGFNNGLKQGVMRVKALGSSMLSLAKGIGNTFKSATDLVGNFTSAVLAAAYESAAQGRIMAEAFEDVREQLGDLSVGTGKMAVEAAQHLKGLGSTFGQFAAGSAARVKYAADMISNFGNLALGSLRDQVGPAALAYGALDKAAGLSGAALKRLATDAIASGEDLNSVYEGTFKGLRKLSKSMNVDIKTIGKNFDAIAKNIATFGAMTNEEMLKLSATMTKTGVSMTSLQGVADKFDNFDTATESVAKLSQAFGVQLDAMELMNAQDPMERVGIIQKAFKARGKSLQDMSRAERKYFAASTGLSLEDLNATFGENAVAVDTAAMAAERATAAQMSSAEAMNDMANSINQTFRPLERFISFMDAFFSGISKGFEQSGVLTIFQSIAENIKTVGISLGMFLGKVLAQSEKFKGFVKGFHTEAIGFAETISGLTTAFVKGEKGLDAVLDEFFTISADKMTMFVDFLSEVVSMFTAFVTRPDVKKAIDKFTMSLADLIYTALKNPYVGITIGGALAFVIGNAFLGAFLEVGKLITAFGALALMKSLASYFGPSGGGGKALMSDAVKFKDSLFNFFKKSWELLGKTFGRGGHLAKLFGPLAQSIGRGLMSTLKFTLKGLFRIALPVVLVYELIKGIKKSYDVIKKSPGLTSEVAVLASLLGGFVYGILNTVSFGLAEGLVSQLSDYVTTQIAKVTSSFINMIDIIQGVIKFKLDTAILGMIEFLTVKIEERFPGLLGNIHSKILEWGKVFTSSISQVFYGIKNSLSDKIKQIFGSDLINSLTESFNGFIQQFKDNFIKDYNRFASMLEKIPGLDISPIDVTTLDSAATSISQSADKVSKVNKEAKDGGWFDFMGSSSTVNSSGSTIDVKAPAGSFLGSKSNTLATANQGNVTVNVHVAMDAEQIATALSDKTIVTNGALMKSSAAI